MLVSSNVGQISGWNPSIYRLVIISKNELDYYDFEANTNLILATAWLGLVGVLGYYQGYISLNTIYIHLPHTSQKSALDLNIRI